MRRTDPGGILTAAGLAIALGASTAGAQEWKEHRDAGVKAQAAGDYEKAEALMKRALAAAEAAGAGGTHAVVEALVGLSGVYMAQERTAESSVVLDQALLLLVRAPAAEPADFAEVYGSLAVLRMLQKNYVESESLLKRALAVEEKTLGPKHADVASTLQKLAAVAIKQENHAEAETYARRVLAIREAQPDVAPLDLAEAYHMLGVLAALEKNDPTANALFHRVLEIKEKALGADHLDVASTLMELASVRLVKGLNGTLFSFLATVSPAEKAKAEQNKAEAGFPETAALLARALAIRDKRLGPDDPKTVEVVLALAVALTEQEDFARAEPYVKRLLAVREKTLGPEHSEVIDVVAMLTDNTLKLRHYREAIPLLERLIAAKKANTPKEAGNPAEALEALRLPTFVGEPEKDAADDLDAKLRRAVRLAGLEDAPALGPTEADLAFLKREEAVPADATLAALDDLLKVELGKNPIDDARMAHLRGLVNLKSLSVRPARMIHTTPNVTDAGLAPLRKLTDLRHLVLTGTTIHGAGFENLAGMTRLEQLDAGFTLVDDAGLAHLPSLPQLRTLNLSGTRITDASIPAIKKLTGLTYLGLLGTKVSAAGVDELQRGRAELTIHRPDDSGGSILISSPPPIPPPP